MVPPQPRVETESPPAPAAGTAPTPSGSAALGAPLIEVDHADVRLAGRALLRGVSFTLRRGDAWAIIGPNGSGKTSLLRLLRGELWPFPVGRRTYHFPGPPSDSPIGARERIAIVSPEQQDAYVRRDWDVGVERVVLGGFTDSVWPQEGATPAQGARISEVLSRLGIDRLRGRSMLELSTGERRRVLLARALAPDPLVLLLDEATEGLDRASRGEFLAAISEVARAGTTLVVATHRADELIPEIERVAVMEAGGIARAGGRELARGLVDPLAPGGAQPEGDAGRRARAGAIGPLLALRGVSVHLDDGTPVLHELTWSLHDGESWAVVGANGAGKTSFLRLVAGELRPMPGGQVARRGLPMPASRDEIQAELAFVGPDLHARHAFDVPVLDVVVGGLRGSIGITFGPSTAERAAARDALARAGAAALAARTVHAISYGELRRVLLARALVRAPRLLLLDEPFAGLDPDARARLAETLAALGAEGVQLLVSAHHDEDLGPAIRHRLLLDRGRIVHAGPWRAEA